MRSPFSLGRLLGIDIHLDISWIVIFALITIHLALFVLPSIHPAWSMSFRLLWALVAALLFFGSLIAHELAHARMALAYKIPVSRITLFVFGGVSNIEHEPGAPHEEFLIAVVGPLTSILLGITFLFLGGIASGEPSKFAWITSATSLIAMNGLALLFIWLGMTNVLIGLFNLIPAFPLDGGRMFRALVWRITHNLRSATLIATRLGQGIAFGFALCGVLMAFGANIPPFGTGLLNGVWLIAIAWFVFRLATSAYAIVVAEEALKHIAVSSVMRSSVPIVPANIPVEELINMHLLGTDAETLAVVSKDAIVGVVHVEDLAKIPETQWSSTRVDTVMTPTPALGTTVPQEMAVDAWHRLIHEGKQELLVVDHERVVGLLRTEDIMRWLKLHALRITPTPV